VGHVLTPTQQVVQQPVQPVYQQPVQPVYQQQQPVVVQPSVQPVVVSNQSSGNGFLWFFLIVALGAIGYLMYRAATQRNNDEVGLDLPFAPIQKFNQIQTAFAMGNVSVLNETLGPNVYDQMIHDLPAAEDRKNPNLTQISYNVEEHTKNFLAIRYHYTDADENNRYAEDVWNFVLINGAWKLDGIQQIV
ncbi:MAG TPA: hypothetical protein VFM18_11330, partial [Methanosarcina sp.]|nr:hypothetical protein [Methanosarcina sp.]